MLHRHMSIYAYFVYYTVKPASYNRFMGYNITFVTARGSENTEERRLSGMIAYIAEKIANLSWHIETNIVSMVLFGEYPYPVKEDYE